MGKSWIVSRRRARRPLLPSFISKATFSVYRTTLNPVDWFRTWQVWPNGGMAKWAGPGIISSHRPVITLGTHTLSTKSEL